MRFGLTIALPLVLGGCWLDLDGLPPCSRFYGYPVDLARKDLENSGCVRGVYEPVRDLCPLFGADAGFFGAADNQCGEALDAARYSCDQCWTDVDGDGCGLIFRNDTRTYCASSQF